VERRRTGTARAGDDADPPPRPAIRSFALAASLALLAGAPLDVAAHDFWIEPGSFRPKVGAPLAVHLVVGQRFRGDALPRNPALIERFVLVSGAGETPVSGAAADEPAGRVTPAAAGLAWIAYRSLESPLSLDADKFDEYLREEGLESIVAERARRGESGRPSRELFSRAAKSLVQVGGAGYAGFDRPLGLALELVPERNPYALRRGGELPVRLLWQGRPLAGALVSALPYASPEAKQSLRSDRDGRVRFRGIGPGVWLVKAVQMVRAADDPNADWRSVWASLTFEVPGE
jgi:uncharacterized GH25 family protein